MKRLTLIASLLFFGMQLLHAQCINGDCVNGTGIYLYPSGAKYIGQFVDGKMEGIGSCYYSDGSKYQGEWEGGYPEGEGIKVFADGSQRRGLWKKGQPYEAPTAEPVKEAPPTSVAANEEKNKPAKKEEKQQTGCVSGDCNNGQGIYIYPSGAIYIGDFVNGEIHGIGACYYSDGSKYQGNWKNRYPEGKGTKIFADGTQWSGSWVKGQPVDSNGKVIDDLFPNKELAADQTDIQTGCMSGDCKHGSGKWAYADGSKYEGAFKFGKPHGQGTFVDVDGEKYTGEFHSGVPHGKGRMVKPDGTVLEGKWEQGTYMGKQDESIAKNGCIQGNCQNGRGTFVSPKDGARYVGAFANGQPHGQGVIYYTNGERYSGQFSNGKINGEGTLFLLDGTEVTGKWENGVFMGEEKTTQPPVVVDTPQPKPRSVKVWAVVIGVASYNHMPTLRYTDDDAYRMFAFLKSPEGGALADHQIKLLIDEDATKERIVEAMRDVFTKAGPNDLVFLYYSGHGLKGSFLPIDFDGFNNRLEHKEINEILEESPAKYKLCIADACHSGSLLAMKSGSATNILESYYETLAKAEAGTALIMSSKSEETSLESSGLRQGVFSHFLIRGLKGEADTDQNKVITVGELFAYINDNVRKYTGNRQSPVIQGDYDSKMTVGVVR